MQADPSEAGSPIAVWWNWYTPRAVNSVGNPVYAGVPCGFDPRHRDEYVLSDYTFAPRRGRFQ